MSSVSWRVSTLTLSCYFFSGISLTIFNKWMLGRAPLHDFGYPITLILCHMLSNFALSAAVIRLVLYHQLAPSTFFPGRLSLRIFATRFVPIGILFALDITLTNLSFKFVPVSLTEIVKSGVPCGLMLYSALMGDHFMLVQKAMVVCILSAGIALTSLGELEFNEIGFGAACGALVSGVLRLILLEKLLDEQDENSHTPTPTATATDSGTEKVAELDLPATLKKNKMSKNKKYELVSGAGFENDEKSLPATKYQHSRIITSKPRPIDTASFQEEEKLLNDSNEGSFELPQTSPLLRRRSSPRLASIVPQQSPSKSPLSLSASASASHLPSLARSPTGKSGHSSVSLSPLSLPHTHHSAKKHRLHPMLSMFYFSPVAAVVLIPSFVAFEFQPLMNFADYRSAIVNVTNAHTDRVPNTDFLADSEIMLSTVGLLLCSALLAFGLNVSELMTIQHTSALTLCVIASIKFLLVLVVTTVIFNHPFSETNLLGCMLSVIGIASYNFIKWKEISLRESLSDDSGHGASNTEKQSLTSSASSMTLNLDIDGDGDADADGEGELDVSIDNYAFTHDSDHDHDHDEDDASSSEIHISMIKMAEPRSPH